MRKERIRNSFTNEYWRIASRSRYIRIRIVYVLPRKVEGYSLCEDVAHSTVVVEQDIFLFSATRPFEKRSTRRPPTGPRGTVRKLWRPAMWMCFFCPNFREFSGLRSCDA